MTRSARSEGPTNVEVVTYALAELDGAKRPVHLERIAVKAHELTPGSFRWDLDQYASLIDKDKVRVSLTDAEKADKGGLVQGVGVSRKQHSKRSDQWRLTATGAAWVLEHQDRLRTALGRPAPALKKGKADALRRRVAQNPLYEEFVKTEAVSNNPYAFTDLLECSPDAANSIVEQRLDELEAQIRLLNDQQLLAFLHACATAHHDMLERS